MKNSHSTGNSNTEIPKTQIVRPGVIPGSDTEDIIQHDDAIFRHELGDSLKLEEGSKLGDYILGSEIGRGGMGVVYEAFEISLGRKVALKILPPSAKFDKMQALRFANESRAAAHLDHPNIVPVYAVGEENGVHFYAMRLVEGYDLSQMIKHVRYDLSTDHKHSENATPQLNHASTIETPEHSGSPLPKSRVPSRKTDRVNFTADDFLRTRTGRKFTTTRRAATKVAQIGVLVADALQHAHDSGILHRDIKPRNLMLDRDGVVWVMDFGLAQIKDNPSLTQTGMLIGTLRYMSPEQAAGLKAVVDQRSDIYSLGVTLAELLVLQYIVKGTSSKEILQDVLQGAPPSIRKIDPNVPIDLAVILEKAMARNVGDRYTTAAELADDLTRFLNNEPIRAKRPHIGKRCLQWFGRHRAVASTLIVAFVCMFLMAVSAAGVVWNALVLKQEQLVKTQAALTESEGQRLLANAALELPTNPGLSLALGIAGANAAPGIEADETLQAAMDANHEYKTVYLDSLQFGQVTISPDGRTVVSCTPGDHYSDGSIPAIGRSTSDGEIVWTLDSGDCITSAAFSRSGQYIITTSSPIPSRIKEGEAISRPPVLWEAATGNKLRTISGTFIREAHPAMFDSNKPRVVLSQETNAIVYDLVSGKTELILRGHAGPVTYAEFSPDGRRILTVSTDGTLRVWNSEDGRQLRAPINWDASDAQYVTAAFTAASGFLALCDRNGVSLYKSDLDAQESDEPQFTSHHVRMSVSREQHQIALLDTAEDIVSIVSSHTLDPICDLQLPGELNKVVFHPTDKRLMTICKERIYLFQSESGKQLGELAGHTSTVNSTCYSATSGVVATVGNDKTLRLWHSESGDMRSQVLPSRDGQEMLPYPSMISLHEENNQIAVSQATKFTTSLFDYDGNRLPATFPGKIVDGECHTEKLVTVVGNTISVNEASTSRELYSGEFSSPVQLDSELVAGGEKLLVNTSRDAFLVDIATRSRTRLCRINESVLAIAESPDASLLLLSTSKGRCLAIDPHTGRELWSRDLAFPAYSLEISSDSLHYAITDSSGKVQILKNGESIPVTQFRLPAQYKTKFVNDKSRIVCWNPKASGKVQFRNAENGDVLAEHDSTGRIAVQCHPTQPLVAVSGPAGAYIWNATTNEKTELTNEPCRPVSFADDRVAVLTGENSPNVHARPLNGQQRFTIYSLEPLQVIYQETLPMSAHKIRVDRDNRIFAITQQGFLTDVFSLDTCAALKQTAPMAGPVIFSGFLTRGRLVSVSADSHVEVSDATGMTERRFVTSTRGLTAAALSPDKKLLVTADSIAELKVWGVDDGLEKGKLSGHRSQVSSLRFDKSGHFLVSNAPEDSVHLWDLRTSEAKEFVVPQAVHTEISGDGLFLLVVSGQPGAKDRKAWLIDVTLNTIKEVSQSTGTNQAVFSPDGKHYGLLGSHGQVDIVELKSGKTIASIPRLLEATATIAFSNSHEVVTDSQSYLTCWDIRSGEQTFQHQKPDQTIFWPTHSSRQPITSDSKWLIATSQVVRRIPRQTEKEALKLAPRAMTKKERQQFRLEPADVQRREN